VVSGTTKVGTVIVKNVESETGTEIVQLKQPWYGKVCPPTVSIRKNFETSCNGILENWLLYKDSAIDVT
jgi:hypothetical protein